MTRARRSDAIRNRQLLLDAARAAFTKAGVTVPLEAIAADAGVSIGTLYNHFGTRDRLIEAVLAPVFAHLRDIADRSAQNTDPWEAFELLVVGICELQATDRAVADIMGLRHPATGELLDAGAHISKRFSQIIGRAKRQHRIRPDFRATDLGPIIWSNARIAELSPDDPAPRRRHLAFMLDGLRR
jgi:AcrR family transcriptional regulator